MTDVTVRRKFSAFVLSPVGCQCLSTVERQTPWVIASTASLNFRFVQFEASPFSISG